MTVESTQSGAGLPIITKSWAVGEGAGRAEMNCGCFKEKLEKNRQEKLSAKDTSAGWYLQRNDFLFV